VQQVLPPPRRHQLRDDDQFDTWLPLLPLAAYTLGAVTSSVTCTATTCASSVARRGV